MIKGRTLLIIFILPILVVSCNDIAYEDTEVYPTVIEKLSEDELIARNQRYHQQNNNRICSTLNEYGFTGFSRVLFQNDINPCLTGTFPKVHLTYQNSLLEQAKQSLVYNSEFTNVEASNSLVLKETLPLNGCTICEGPNINNVPLQWKFTFQEQQMNGVEVEGTEINVYVDSYGVNRIWGNWYTFNDPGFTEVGYLDAQNKILNMELSYQNENQQTISQTITNEHLTESPTLAFVPIPIEDGLAIHKCWIVPVKLSQSDSTKWHVKVSVKTGEVLSVEIL